MNPLAVGPASATDRLSLEYGVRLGYLHSSKALECSSSVNCPYAATPRAAIPKQPTLRWGPAPSTSARPRSLSQPDQSTRRPLRRRSHIPLRPNTYSLSKNGSGLSLGPPPVVKVKVSPKEQFVLLVEIRGRLITVVGPPAGVFQEAIQLPWLNNWYV